MAPALVLMAPRLRSDHINSNSINTNWQTSLFSSLWVIINTNSNNTMSLKLWFMHKHRWEQNTLLMALLENRSKTAPWLKSAFQMPSRNDVKERLKSRVLNRCWCKLRKCHPTPTFQYFYLLNISSYSPTSPNNPCGSGVSVSCTCGDGSTFTPGSLHCSTTTNLSSSWANIFRTIFLVYIGWFEKYNICERLCCLANTSSFRSIIDNKQCGERPGNPCGSGRPTCQCPDGQSFRLDGGDDDVDSCICPSF